MSKHILVAGGAGFIGSHLCESLLAQGNCNVYCLDNFSTGSKENVAHLISNPHFKLIEHDIVNPITLDVPAIDQIYNLACPASPVHYQANPIRTIKINTIGIINVLGLVKKYHARILQASTSEVYGDPEVHPQREDYKGSVNTIGPRACYDEGKRVAEALFFEYYRHHKVEIRVARIFNTYGPRMAVNDGRVVSNFIVQALQNEDITIYGKGDQTRSFCYVADLVDGLYRLMNGEHVGPINLGNPDERTILEIAHEIVKKTGATSTIVFKPLPADDPHRRQPDITKATSLLGWKPHIPLEQGLESTISYFKKKINSPQV